MAKTIYSNYTTDAVRMLGLAIRAERKAKKMSEQTLADRCGVSRSFIKRLEKGDPACGIGSAFEAAYVVGISLFDMGPNRLSSELKRTEERLTLLPKSIRQTKPVINDDF